MSIDADKFDEIRKGILGLMEELGVAVKVGDRLEIIPDHDGIKECYFSWKTGPRSMGFEGLVDQKAGWMKSARDSAPLDESRDESQETVTEALERKGITIPAGATFVGFTANEDPVFNCNSCHEDIVEQECIESHLISCEGQS